MHSSLGAPLTTARREPPAEAAEEVGDLGAAEDRGDVEAVSEDDVGLSPAAGQGRGVAEDVAAPSDRRHAEATTMVRIAAFESALGRLFRERVLKRSRTSSRLCFQSKSHVFDGVGRSVGEWRSEQCESSISFVVTDSAVVAGN